MTPPPAAPPCGCCDGAAGKSKYPTVRVTGFFQTDVGWIDQDEANRATLGDLRNGWDFRRARLAAAGDVAQNVGYMMECDFAQAQPFFSDWCMEFKNVGNFMNLRVGRFRQPFGMTELTSIRELTFLERPLLFALAPFRQTGVEAFGNNDGDHSTITWGVSGYRYLSDNFGNVYGDQGGWGTATRVTWLPIYENCGDLVLHLGVDYSFNDAANNAVQYANFPEFFLGQNPAFPPSNFDRLPLVSTPPFVNTGPFDFEHSNLFNLEAAAALGRWYMQSEFRWAVVDRLNGGAEVFPGAYAHLRYVLTGELLPYNRAAGVFGRITPHDPVQFGGCGGIGAWELAARWSYLDLNGDALPGPGRSLNNVTLGVNWYLNKFTKFQFNYIHAFLQNPDSAPVLPGVESHAHIAAVRGQIDF